MPKMRMVKYGIGKNILYKNVQEERR